MKRRDVILPDSPENAELKENVKLQCRSNGDLFGDGGEIKNLIFFRMHEII